MRRLAPCIPAIVFLILAGMVIASGKISHRVAYDQLLYHGKAIEIFAAQWPRVDVTDYLSATTPGFHLAMAMLVHLFGLTIAGMQVICALITFILVLVLGQVASVSLRPWHAAALTLPFALSMYVFAAGAWVLPDNAAWAGVLAMLLLCLSPRFSLRHVFIGGVLLTALACTRQIHVWTAGLLIAAAWLRTPEGPNLSTSPMPTGVLGSLRSTLLSRASERVLITAAALLACLPATLVLVWFYGLWGGLVPPTFQYQYHMANPAGPAFLLAVFGVFACFGLGWTLPRVAGAWRSQPIALLGAVSVALALAAFPVTTAGTNADYFAGRRTGLWDVAAKVPAIAHHTSPVIVIAAAIGGVVLASFLSRWKASSAIIVLCAFAGYGLAMAQGGELWQRYAEPFALIMLTLILGLDAPMSGEARDQGLLAKIAPLGMLLLATLFIGLDMRDLHKPGTQRVTDPAPPSVSVSEQVPNLRRDSPWDRYMMRTREWQQAGRK